MVDSEATRIYEPMAVADLRAPTTEDAEEEESAKPRRKRGKQADPNAETKPKSRAKAKAKAAAGDAEGKSAQQALAKLLQAAGNEDTGAPDEDGVEALEASA